MLKHALLSIPEEMGIALRNTAYSPNIKERMDASCAVFDSKGRMLAQAEHIPVHLGSMLDFVAEIREDVEQLGEGDQLMCNDPYRGGTHLPDITLIMPIYHGGKLFGYCANKAHHIDVGGKVSGSMPADSSEIYEEGLIIPPTRIVTAGRERKDVMRLLTSNTRSPREQRGDLRAQMAANNLGAQLVSAVIDRYGTSKYIEFAREITEYSRRRVVESLDALPDGTWSAIEYLDDDGAGGQPVKLKLRITKKKRKMKFDFTGTDKQRKGAINAPLTVTRSAVYFVFRCITDSHAPPNYGCFEPVGIFAPKGTVVNPEMPAGVAAGNVETSQRITDLCFEVLSKALPGVIPAQSQGTMNNLLIGSTDPQFSYYETMGGGAGAGPGWSGASGVQVNMTNTANTPIEVLESTYPLFVERYELVDGSAGIGRHVGGKGIRRIIRIECDEASVTILSERRIFAPSGRKGGTDGKKGSNYYIRQGRRYALAPKGNFTLTRGDRLVIETPGGGGYGRPVIISRNNKNKKGK